MRCSHCGKEGAVKTGMGRAYHPNCFISVLGLNLGKDMGSLDDLLNQKRAEEEKQQQWEEQQERERQERARRYQESQWQNQQRAYGFNDFFSGNWSQQRRQHGPPPPRQNATMSGSITVMIDEKRLKQLLMLCHPDKHDNSERSNEVTRWLIDIKVKLEKTA